MSRLTVCIVAIVLAASLGAAEPVTVAEKSNYQATSTHAEVVAFCRDLAKRSKLVTLDELGTTQEGKKLPLLIIADPPIATPEEAVKAGKMVVFAFGNIHAGEVDGKEALLAMCRDIALTDKHPLLKDLILLVVPIFNADGNDKIDPKNRPWQSGPEKGVGVRANAQGFDLNRDFIKLESPEVRALVRLLNRWDPAIVIDTHTTNGSYHRYKLTYDGPRHPLADVRVIDYVRDTLLPDAGKRLKAKTNFDSFFYGNFDMEHKKWETYPAQPRFGIQYVALRNRIALLSESYVYATYKERIDASRAFVEGCLEHTAAHREMIAKLLVEADKPRETIPVRTATVSLGRTAKVLGVVEEEKDGKVVPTKQARDYEVDLILKCQPDVKVNRPWGYLVPAEHRKTIEVLRWHGVTCEEIKSETKFRVDVYRLTKVTTAEREFQKHKLATLEVVARTEMRTIPAGTFRIRTEQRLGNMASFLLEPQSEDGLATWNFFDDGLAVGKDYPILRAQKPR